MLRALCEALPRLGMDPDVGAIVLTGAGRAFCAGGDVRGMAARKERTFEERLEDLRWKQQIPVLLRTTPKVIIAAINGTAVGAGLGLALACDMRIAARSAKFGTAFVGVGFSGDLGGCWTLTRLVGTAKARELYLTGEVFSSEEANRLGLLTKLVDDDAVLTEAMAMAGRFAAGPRVAYGYIKRNMYAAETQSLPEVLELEAMHQMRTLITEDHKEAITAFVEKRKPAFRGR
jgi:2-(1,2-epoxy-1,2-dihydrophenyl)acetyl-CoA isomerase